MNTLASFTATDTLWMLVCACFVFFMQAGFTCYEAGLVQSKNVISVAIENIFNLTISIVLFSLVGFPMMFGETIFSADSSAETAFVFLQIMFAAVSVTIFAGALSERTKLAPLLVAGAVSAALIYPLFGRLAWGSHLSGNASWLESLTNVVKHAQAKEAVVTGQSSQRIGFYTICIKDDGIGFNPESEQLGVGIPSMNDRVKMLGGTFHLYSMEGKGTEIIMEVPHHGRNQ